MNKEEKRGSDTLASVVLRPAAVKQMRECERDRESMPG